MPAAKTITSNTNQDLSGDKQVVPYFWIKAIAAAVSGSHSRHHLLLSHVRSATLLVSHGNAITENFNSSKHR